MRIYFAIFFALMSLTARSQQDTAVGNRLSHAPFERHTTVATLSVGFIDPYRSYTVPAGFEKSNTSGFVPVYLKVEYAVNKRLGIAGVFAYDGFVYNYNQLYNGYNGIIRRYHANNFRLFSGGINAFYHFGKSHRFDPFIGAGISLNNIHYSAYPQGDSTVEKSDHTISLCIRAGARYYITDKYSLFGDVGYDNQSIFSLGVSCRFFARKEHTTTN
jgi:opacity protein-like surface antigen